eukprot:scaffold1019_cov172-Amphora_coffeaeformis.AAC.3
MSTTQKRKGSDFGAATAVAATVINTSTTTTTTRFPLYGGGASSSSLDEDWQTLQDKMQQMLAQFQNSTAAHNNDPLMETIDALSAKPGVWQGRIEALPYEAANVEEKIDDEYQSLQAQWQQQSASQLAHQERLAELRSTLQALRGESDALQAALDDAREDMANQSERRQRLRQAAEDRLRTMAHKIPKLQQQISMYAMCTGIKWDYDNADAWAGHVNVPSKQTYQSFYFPRGQVSPEEMMDTIWVLMEG